MTLCSVSLELLVEIFKHLDGVDFCNVSQTCRSLCNALYFDDAWRAICKRDYGVTSLEGWQTQYFRELYIQVLYKYGYLLGLWRRHVDPYGGLVYIRAGQGYIVAEDCLPPFDLDIRAPLRLEPLFSITLSGDGVKAACLTVWEAPDHPCTIKKLQEGHNAANSTNFTFTCENQAFHEIPVDSCGARDVQSLRHWIEREFNNGDLLLLQPHLVQLVLTKYKTMHSAYREPIHFSPLQLRTQLPNQELLLRRGVFKGTYGSHGIELLLVTVTPENIVGTKLTGDPNVPSGQVSFDVDLSLPVITEHEPAQGEALGLGMQPFQIGREYEARYADFPSVCKARYQAKGRIASHGFVSPKWTPGQFVFFHEDMFGFLWLDLMSFSVFRRATEPFLAI